MTRIYSAAPTTRRLIVSPGEKDVLIMSGRRPVERPIQQMAEPNWNRNAPITEIPEQFKAAMRAKGWLRSK
jgi:hypothetical protein